MHVRGAFAGSSRASPLCGLEVAFSGNPARGKSAFSFAANRLWRRRRVQRSQPCAAAPRWNPQNVDNPLSGPSPERSAEEAVTVQIEALMSNDHPWPNHGIQTLYEFGEGIGGLDPCWYFGYRKDLYHMDHFMGQLSNAFPQLINAVAYETTGVKELGPERTMVQITALPAAGGGSCTVTFALRRKSIGANEGSWITRMLLPGTIQDALDHIDALQRGGR